MTENDTYLRLQKWTYSDAYNFYMTECPRGDEGTRMLYENSGWTYDELHKEYNRRFPTWTKTKPSAV